MSVVGRNALGHDTAAEGILNLFDKELAKMRRSKETGYCAKMAALGRIAACYIWFGIAFSVFKIADANWM